MHDHDQDILNLRAALHDFETSTTTDRSRERIHLRRECVALATTVEAILAARERDQQMSALAEDLRARVGIRDQVALVDLLTTGAIEQDITRAMAQLGFDLWTRDFCRVYVRRSA